MLFMNRAVRVISFCNTLSPSPPHNPQPTLHMAFQNGDNIEENLPMEVMPPTSKIEVNLPSLQPLPQKREQGRKVETIHTV